MKNEMTYEFWMDFATRLIKAMQRTPERTEKLLEETRSFIESYKGTTLVGWDREKHKETDMYVCDHFDEWFGNSKYHRGYKQTNFLRDIVCAVRAGLDIAVQGMVPKQTSSGVVGFTVGTLRRMYPEGLPGYVKNFFDPPLTDDDKDEEHVWL